MEKYEQISIVGEGSYGVVMKCRHRKTDQIVAVKKFFETEEDATIRKMALREIRMLKRLKHENLVTMIEVFRHKKRFYLVFEYLEGTVLDELDKMPNGLGDERCRERIFQVVRAISFCHSNNIIHRDVKPENVLVSSLGVVKLCDFGFARLISLSGEACTGYVATRWYRAPELIVAEPNYGVGVDIWSIGCLFAEMMTGDPLFPGESDIDQFYLIVKLLGTPCLRHQQLMEKSPELRRMINFPFEDSVGLYKYFSSWPPQTIEFLSSCVKMDPQQRLSADELLKHPYFNYDRFSRRFLSTLREKVNIEFNNPLLLKFKTDILMSTDKTDRITKRSTLNEPRWKFTLTKEGVKRKFSYENLPNDVLCVKNINLTQQMDNHVQKNDQIPLLKQVFPQGSTENVVKMRNFFKINSNLKNNNNCSASTQRKSNSVMTEPLPFQSHFEYGDNNVPNNDPVISNNNFNNHSKESSNKLQKLKSNNSGEYRAPLLTNPKTQKFLKKIERNIAEAMFANGDRGTHRSSCMEMWFPNTGITGNMNHHCIKDVIATQEVRAVSPSKTNKNTLLRTEEQSPQVTSDYRCNKAKRKRNTLDISLPLPVNEKG